MAFEVHVSNIGKVLSRASKKDALKTFNVYVEQSKSNIGRAGMESVWIFKDGDLFKEFVGKLYRNADGE